MGREAGPFDLRVIVLAKGPGDTDSSGFPIDTWVELVANYPARKRVLSTAETWRAGRESAATLCIYEIRYRADMDPDVLDLPASRRIVDRGKTYDVVGAEANGRHDAVVLTCQTGDVPAEATRARVAVPA